MLIVSTSGLGAGEYVITRKLLSIPRHRSTVEVWHERDRLAVHTGGFIGSLLRKRQPEMIRCRGLINDPVLGPDMQIFDSCLLLPLFSGGTMCKRVFMFRRGWDEVDYTHVERSLLILNLIEAAIENLQVAQENADLARALDQQFEQISRIQRRLLPSQSPASVTEQDSSIEIGMRYHTAERAGGDYFHFFPLPDGEMAIVVADVSGHGADAAMIMGMLHAVLASDAPVSEGPAALLKHANNRLLPMMLEGKFVTAVVAIINPVTGLMRYASAGHPPLRIVDVGSGKVECLSDASGDLIGILEDARYPEAVVGIRPGQRVLFYTDGLTDSLDPAHAGKGVSELDALLRVSASLSVGSLAEILVDAAIQAGGSDKTVDDITVVVVGLSAGSL
jgi:sigma-B regulation protein RsbU (phosphoserine phosphatase)